MDTVGLKFPSFDVTRILLFYYRILLVIFVALPTIDLLTDAVLRFSRVLSGFTFLMTLSLFSCMAIFASVRSLCSSLLSADDVYDFQVSLPFSLTHV